MGVAIKRSEVLDDVKETLGVVPEWVGEIPEPALGGFWGVMKNFYLAETLIPNKYKELIGLAVSGATRCKYCQLFHVESARLNGATDAEIAEASMVGGMTMMASTFLNAQGIDFDTFRDETEQIVSYVKRQAAGGGHPTPSAPQPRARH
jgi:AhpD family alkylhydroperoxidase